jgi:hypothetical protein
MWKEGRKEGYLRTERRRTDERTEGRKHRRTEGGRLKMGGRKKRKEASMEGRKAMDGKKDIL